MHLWSGPPIDPTVDLGTQSAILAIRSRRLRVQRRFARMLISAIVMALLGAGGSTLLSGGSNSKRTAPGASNVAHNDAPPSNLNQQVRDLNDVARQLRNTP
jgi:hypothetical protein